MLSGINVSCANRCAPTVLSSLQAQGKDLSSFVDAKAVSQREDNSSRVKEKVNSGNRINSPVLSHAKPICSGAQRQSADLKCHFLAVLVMCRDGHRAEVHPPCCKSKQGAQSLTGDEQTRMGNEHSEKKGNTGPRWLVLVPILRAVCPHSFLSFCLSSLVSWARSCCRATELTLLICLYRVGQGLGKGWICRLVGALRR